MTCDLRLADASLKSPEKAARKLRRELYIRVLLGYEKRDLRSGSVSWGGITYKLVLLPLWVGTYRYRGKRYPMLVNGAQMWFYFSRMRPREYEPVGVEAEGSATDLF